MRIEKMASIVLTEEEMKDVFLRGTMHVLSKTPKGWELYNHLQENFWTIETNEGGGFVICVDGIVETEEV